MIGAQINLVFGIYNNHLAIEIKMSLFPRNYLVFFATCNNIDARRNFIACFDEGNYKYCEYIDVVSADAIFHKLQDEIELA